MNVLVLGYGNPLRGDDGAGPAAARLLEEEKPGSGVEVAACHQLMPELAEKISRTSLVIFLDACASDPPGEVRSREIRPSRTPGDPFTHGLTPEALMVWAGTLYGSVPRAYLVSIGACSFELDERLSPAVAQGLPEMVACVRSIIARFEEITGEKTEASADERMQE